MTKQTRTPWFSAQSQPPVNGGPSARYEWRCQTFRPGKRTKRHILENACRHCQWRGLTKPGSQG